MMKHAALVALTLLLAGCGEEEREPSPPPVNVGAASGGRATIGDWLPEGQRSGAQGSSAHGGSIPGAPHGGAAPHGGGAPHGGAAPPLGTQTPGGAMVRGTVTETMDSGGYTYMQVDTSDGPVWVAGAQREIAVGTTIEASGMVMQGFRSNTLDRTFDQLVLASAVEEVPPAE